MIEIHQGDNLAVLATFASASFDLVYIDPPFNTGRTQRRTSVRSLRDPHGKHVGFGGKRYRSEAVAEHSYADSHGDGYLAHLEPRLLEARRVLARDGSFFLHLDSREVHYAKVLCDRIFGRANFQNEIIWAYDYGARSRKRWSAKHDHLLWYSADARRYTFDYDAIDRIPYLAPGLVGAEKAARGKTPTDVWWNTIVSPTGKEKTGYPTQKPLGILRRIVAVHSRRADRLLDFYAGSGSFGAAALELGRDCVLVDHSRAAVGVMKRRLAAAQPVVRVHRATAASRARGAS